MPAKIKTPAAKFRNSPRPRGSDKHSFEKVYWPFIPVILAFAVLLPISVQTGALSRFSHHPFSRVLAYSTSQDAGSMLAETNYDRQRNNQAPLKISPQLSRAAMAKAADMASRNYWSHDTPEGSPPWTFVTAAGYSYVKVGENLATGFYNEEEAIKGWMASPPHRDNMLDPSYSEVGFGFANAPHYNAAGGGPATVFVAFYGEPPSSSVILARKLINNGLSPSSANPNNRLLTTKTAPIQVAFARTEFNAWAPVGLALIIIGVMCGLALKHARSIKRSLKAGENYAWRHPLFDASLLVLAALAVILWQTIGLVK